MRRLLLVFLLVFMPLQSIWAAASPYCEHESAPQASHFGHHVHEHHGDEGADHSAPGASPSTLADMDCHACHGTGGGLAHSASAQAIVVAVAHPPGHPHPLRGPNAPTGPSSPERRGGGLGGSVSFPDDVGDLPSLAVAVRVLLLACVHR
ncbi:hypothetical protein [Acidovorax sp. K2F]|uniref:hypothetical protein n=1 Tax=Acidovorax sp. K2F TaxID=2978125 RepID=UPI0021B09A57|nr:hypothetical protein [Acidovorax sp. K2F]MCT6718505.1 hypothetical protein [Acidovorax sp. K2F]